MESTLFVLLFRFASPCVRDCERACRNVTLPSTRGIAFGLFNLSDDVGKGLGPAVVSMMVARRGRESAFTLSILAWLACGSVLLIMMVTFQRDERRVCAKTIHIVKSTRST